MKSPSIPTRRFGALFALVLLWLPVSAIALGERQLWNPMEPRYAGIVRSMVQSGDFLVPRYEGRAYDQKPPLYFWLAAAGASIGGEDSRWALRFPSALGALLGALAVASLGRLTFGRSASFWCGAVALCSFLPFWSSRFANLDTLAAAGMAIAVLGLLRASRREGGLFGSCALVALGTWLGVMTKGPLIPMIVLLQVVVLGFAPRSHLAKGIVASAIGIGVGLLLFAAWYLPARAAAGAAWGDALLFGQGVDRHLGAGGADRHGAFYYLRILWSSAAPWSVFLPLALWWHARSRVARRKIVFAAGWFVALLVVLSLYPVRRERYFVPAVPAMALIIGPCLASFVRTGAKRWPGGWRRSTRILAGALPLIATGALALICAWPEGILEVKTFEGRKAKGIEWLIEARPTRLLFVGLASLGFLFALRSIRSVRPTGDRLFGLLGATALVWCAWASLGAPAVDAGRDDASLLAVLRKARQDTPGPLTIVGPYAVRESTAGWFHWYLHEEPRQVLDLDDGEALREAEDRLILVRKAHLVNNPGLLPADAEQLHADPVGRASLVLFRLPRR